MSQADQFRQYAEEACFGPPNPKPKKIELAHTWTQAALASDALVNCHTRPPPGAMSGTPEARSHAAT